MPEIELTHPGDGVASNTTTSREGDAMSADATSADVGIDRAELILSSLAESHETLTVEISANEESAHSLVRHSGAQKFQREDPIEAAAAEMILQLNE